MFPWQEVGFLVTEQIKHLRKVGAESTEFTVMPENGFSPRAISITAVIKSGKSYVSELLGGKALRKWLSETSALEEKAPGFH